MTEKGLLGENEAHRISEVMTFLCIFRIPFLAMEFSRISI